jgi:folate-binding protein YgfZ
VSNPRCPEATISLSETFVRERAAAGGPALLEDTVLEISGPDALEFLDRLAATALSGTAPGRWRTAAFSNGSGRLLAWGRILLDADGRVRLAVPGHGGGESLETHLVRHVLRSRVTIARREDLAVWGDPRSPSWSPRVLAGEIERKAGEDSPYELSPLGITIRPRVTDAGETGDPHALLAWRLRELEEDVVRLPGSLAGTFTLPALGPFVTALVSWHKGCFPGQEVVRKMLRLGSGKRRLARGEADGPLAAGTALVDESGRERATVLTSLPIAGRTLVQLVLVHDPDQPAPVLREPSRGVRCRVLEPAPSAPAEGP